MAKKETREQLLASAQQICDITVLPKPFAELLPDKSSKQAKIASVAAAVPAPPAKIKSEPK